MRYSKLTGRVIFAVATYAYNSTLSKSTGIRLKLSKFNSNNASPIV